ncbi:MAG: hypothetical protein HYZ50_21870 [Deltaproteobacteria bacterium]|nr:hypothetical protein [Deltaproteobacteria bacterium]
MIVPDPFEKKVRIPVRVKNGRVVQLDGDSLPKIRDDAIGELILSAHSIEDSKIRESFQTEKIYELLPTDSSVFLAMSPGVVPIERAHQLISPSDLKILGGFLFAEVKLKETLKMKTRGTKNPILEPCSCFIPVLNKESQSLNHAFTLISTEFETKRISHTGNVFQRGFVKKGEKWLSLDNLRGIP